MATCQARWHTSYSLNHMLVYFFYVSPLTFHIVHLTRCIHMYLYSSVYTCFTMSPQYVPRRYCNGWTTLTNGSDHKWKIRLYMSHEEYLWQVVWKQECGLDKEIQMDGGTNAWQRNTEQSLRLVYLYEYGTQKNIWISKETLLMKQSKTEVIATKCLQHQCIGNEHYT